MAEPLDNLPDESQVQAPKALRDDLGALFTAVPPVPPALDAAVLASARAHLGRTQPRAAVPHRRARTAIRWAGVAAAAAAAAAIFLLAIDLGLFLLATHLGPAREAAAPSPARSAPAVAKTPAAFDKADINHDGRVDILDAFALAKRLESERKPKQDLDIDGNGTVDRRDVEALAHAAVRLPKAPVPAKGAGLSPDGAHNRSGVLSPEGAYYDSPGQRPGKQGVPSVQPCKGVLPRDGGGRAAAGPSTPLQGCVVLPPRVPRALPWAGIGRSFGAAEAIRENSDPRRGGLRLEGGMIQ